MHVSYFSLLIHDCEFGIYYIVIENKKCLKRVLSANAKSFRVNQSIEFPD